MSLIHCWECGAEISSAAPSCPKCGAPPRLAQPPAAPPAPAMAPVPLPVAEPARKKWPVSRIVFHLIAWPALALALVCLAVTLLGAGWRQFIGSNEPALARQGFTPLPPRANAMIDETSQTKEDRYHVYTFTLNRTVDVTIDVEVLIGPAVDVMLYKPDDFARWEERAQTGRGASPMQLLAFSGGPVRDHSRTARLGEGKYYLVIDNTNFGAAQPPTNLTDDVVTARVRISAK